MSASDDTSTHGRKLYSLFVKIRPRGFLFFGNYTFSPENPVGQVIVKEAWVPELMDDPDPKREPVVKKVSLTRTLPDGTTDREETEDRFLPYARKDGRWYHAARKGQLFVMLKLDPATPDTDQGWVYGVVSPEGKTVEAAGRIASCMGCHQDAPHDRLFGPPKE